MSGTVVGMADMKVSASVDDSLVTYALGSCLGIAVYDPTALVGGLLHVMLPLSSIDQAKGQENPAIFVDTGVPALFRACYRLGAVKQRMIVRVAGGASVGAPGDPDQFQIGKRNMLTLRKLLWKNGLLIQAQDVGGHRLARNMTLRIADGSITIKTAGVTAAL